MTTSKFEYFHSSDDSTDAHSTNHNRSRVLAALKSISVPSLKSLRIPSLE